MRKPIIAGNWKMNKTIGESIQMIKKLKLQLTNIHYVDIVVCPPFTALAAVNGILRDSNIKLGAQDLHWEQKGAFTGEVSANMLIDAGCQYVIIGHSERRQYFGETDQTVNRKIKAALACGLIPIVCVGEKLKEREAGNTESVVEEQVTGALSGLFKNEIQNLIIAYEPVWAIGTGKTATPQQANKVHRFIRKLLTQLYDQKTGETIRIQYGGSVTPTNISGLMSQPDIDGALVGGASLEVDSFTKIVNYK